MSAGHTWLQAIRRSPRYALRLMRMPLVWQLLLIEALFTLVYARLWMLAQPFQRVAARLGRPGTPVEDQPPVVLAQNDADCARQVSRAVRWVAKVVPFRSVCLQQAVAAKIMLRRRNIASTLHFGVAISSEGGDPAIKAHAWLRAGSVDVTGFDVAHQYREIVRYD